MSPSASGISHAQPWPGRGSQASWHRGHGRSRGPRRSGRLVLLDVRGQRAQRGEDPAVLVVVRTQLEAMRSEEHTSELQSLMRISYAVFCLKKKKYAHHYTIRPNISTSL